jgi:DNA-binding response OmpR family regulator
MAMAARVLLLEDDEGLRTSLRLVLESAGYDVLEAAEAERWRWSTIRVSI